MNIISTCKLDNLGRIVLPLELRRKMHLTPGEALEIGLDEDLNVLLRKETERCIFCGAQQDLHRENGYAVCEACARSLAQKWGA